VNESRRIEKLGAIGITVWRRRPSGPVSDAAPSPAPNSAAPARIRLEAGGGPWLLVVEEQSRAQFEALLTDVRVLLGADRCRFGTWSDSAESGVAFDEWAAHGIEAAVVFDRREDMPAGFVPAGPLDRLAGSQDARRALWRSLRPLLES
jgi:hypothetical protein